MKTLSIIIPAYNMEKYLDHCIQSVVQSARVDSIELIVVNDGSTDSTSEIAHVWADKYPDSVVVIDKENGGHGSAINLGSKICKGKYFKILDADDWFDTDELDKLTAELDAAEADCVVCNYVRFFEATSSEKVWSRTDGFDIGVVMPLEKYISKYHFELHAVTFKTETYRNADIRVREKCFFDDAQYCLYSYAAVKTVVCYPFNVYHYRLQRDGQSVSPQGFLKHLTDHQVVMFDLCAFSNDADISDEIRSNIIKIVGKHIRFQYGFIAKFANKEQLRDTKLFNKKLKVEYPRIYANIPSDNSVKLLRFVRFGNYGIVKLARKLFLKKS